MISEPLPLKVIREEPGLSPLLSHSLAIDRFRMADLSTYPNESSKPITTDVTAKDSPTDE